MAYQDDFRNKVLAALKAKNLAVDISQEATQQAIVEEAQNVASSESRPMSPEEMKLVLQDVAKQLDADNQQLAVQNKAFTAQSSDFTAFGQPQLAGELGGSYSGGGIAVSVMNKDILIIPTAGTATSINTLSQIDFKIISNPNAYGVLDPREVKASLFNWGERITGNTFDTPVLGIGGAWGGVSYAPTSQWGIGGSQGSGVGASINMATGFGQIIYFKPATSTIYASLFNDLGINADYVSRSFTLVSYNSAIPGALPTSGFAVTFGGIGNSGGLVIAGAANSTQINTVKFLSPLTVLNSTVTDTLTLALSSPAGTSGTQYFVGNGSTQQYVLSSNNLFVSGDMFYASAAGHTHLTRLAKGTANSYLSVDGSNNYTWTSTISASTANVAAATGSTVLYPIMNNSTTSGSALSYDVDFNVNPNTNVLQYATGSIYAGTAISAPLYTSPVGMIIRPGADTATGIQLQTSTGGTFLNLDTTNRRLGVGTSAPSYPLDVVGDINAATGYSYRIAGNLVLNAGGLGTGVTNSSLTSVGTINSGTWAATAITTLYGGIGNLTAFVIGDLLYANTTTTVAKLTAGIGGSVLTSTGTGSTPNYSSPALLSVGTAFTASNVNLVAVGNTNQTHYITLSRSTTGTGVGLSSDSNLSWVPATGVLSASFLSGTAVTVTSLSGTIITAAQTNITSVGTLTGGTWNANTISTTYGGTGSNLSATGNSNKIVVLGPFTTANAATVIDGANTGYLLAANGNGAAPTFTNTTAAAFTFSSGTLSINNAAITTGTISNTPTNATDLANKAYVDSISGGLDPHASVRLTTISAIGGSYRQAGTSGTTWGSGDYILATTPTEIIGIMAGLDTPSSGIALTFGQRVLVKDGVLGGYASGTGIYGAFPTTFGGIAASYVANGIYTVSSVGGAATSGWLLVRATDTDNLNGVQELTGGTFTFVEEGTNYADNAFVCTNDTTSLGPIGFGSTQITWSPFSGGASLTMGQGLSKTGNTVATNYNIATYDSVIANLSRGFSIGGARSGSVGSSSYDTFTVTGSNAALGSATLTVDNAGYTLAGGETAGTVVKLLMRGVVANNTITGAADGWTHAGGTVLRTLTVIGGDILLNGGGFGLTLGSNSYLSTNSNTLAIGAGSSNISLVSASASGTTAPTTHYLVQNGQSQYQLSTSSGTFTAGDIYYGAGTAFTGLARLAFGSGAGNSVLIRGASQPTWGTIALGNSDFVSGILTTTNGGTNGTASPTSGGVAYGASGAYAFTAAGSAGQALLSNSANAPTFGTLTLVGGGTSNTVSGAGISYQFAQYNASGNAISSFALPSANNSVLIAATPTTASWSNGPLGIPYGGNGNTNYVARGIVFTNPAGTANTSESTFLFQSGVGMTITGNNTTINVGSGGGYFINGSAVVSSVAGINGAVGFTSQASNGGTSYIQVAGQSLILNYPGTGITGGGAANRVAYYNAAQEITSNANFTFSPGAATGVGLSINVGTGVSTVLYVNNTNGSATAGYLVDVDQNGAQRFSIDFKGMTEIKVGSGNTALSMATGGRAIFAAATANYASINLPSSAATNPGAGVTQIGDLWFNGTNLYFRKDSNTNQDLLVGSVSGTGIADRIAKWSSTTGLTSSYLSESPAGVGMTITSSSTSIAAGGGTTALLTLQSIALDDNKTDRYFIRGMSTGAGAATTRYFSIDTAGNLRATTKSFDIPHPTKQGSRLVYGVLEGPEHGVYHRGTVEGKGIIQVNLPDYWYKLVGEQYTIQLTPWGNYNVGIASKTENYFTIQLVGDVISRKYKNIKVDYIVHGSRLDAPLDTEQ